VINVATFQEIWIYIAPHIAPYAPLIVKKIFGLFENSQKKKEKQRITSLKEQNLEASIKLKKSKAILNYEIAQKLRDDRNTLSVENALKHNIKCRVEISPKELEQEEHLQENHDDGKQGSQSIKL
jgi:hypothetical protein